MSPSTLARSRDRIKHCLNKKSSGKPDLASPEGKGITAILCEQETVDSLSAEKELENTSLVYGCKSRDLKSLDIPISAPTSFDPVEEQKILREFLDTISFAIDDDIAV